MKDDSDNDEGFVPTKVEEVKPKVTEQRIGAQKKDQRPEDFQSRYIFGDGILRKEPPQVYVRFSACPPEASSETTQSPQRLGREQLEHPYQKYISSRKYSLVYSRNKEKNIFAPESDDFAANEVDLSKVLTAYSPDDYCALKPFELEWRGEKGPEQELVFDSRFEGGNLQYAFKSNQSLNCYSLFLQNDTNSYGYNQWFYFSIRNAKAGTVYRFSIVNLRKKSSFFGKGLKVSVFSLLQAQKSPGSGWTRMGQNIRYERASIRKGSDKKFKFYSLSFEVAFPHDNDFVCLAMNIPYSYSRLVHNLNICQSLCDQQQDRSWTLSTVAHSVCNNAVPCVTIAPRDGPQPQRIVVMLARQHPGETWSSFLMEELLYLLSESKSTAVSWLIRNYTFVFFPMVNVDGVIYGNFRCDIGGFDLNRSWKNTPKHLHPQVCGIRDEIASLARSNHIECVLDLHGHSKQLNTFCYSCKEDSASCRILPKILASLTPIFSFKDCTFGISKYKEMTARAVIHSIIQNENVLTVENSFFGYRDGGEQVQVYDPSTMGSLAEAILSGLSIFLSKGEEFKQFESDVRKNLKQYISYERRGLMDSGSESDPYGDQISLKDKVKKIIPRSFISLENEVESGPARKVKKKKMPKGNSDSGRNFQTIVPTKFRQLRHKREQEQDIVEKEIIERKSLTHYRRHSKDYYLYRRHDDKGAIHSALSEDAIRKSINHVEMMGSTNRKMIENPNEVELPFYTREKPKLVPLKLKNDSLQIFKDAYHATKAREEVERGPGSVFRKIALHHTTKRIGIAERTEEFPVLGVFSENKRKLEMERKRLQQEQSEEKPIISRPYMQNERLEHLKKTTRENPQEKSKANVALISKIWRDNFARYGRDLGVFFGETRQ